MYQVLICDDERAHLKREAELVREILEEAEVQAQITCFLERGGLLSALKEQEGHCLLLLDILLGDDNGVELARELRALNQDLGLIFATTSRDYIFDGYDVHAIQYLIKPLERDRLRRAVLYDYEQNCEDARLRVSGKEGTLSLRLSEILYLESVRRGAVVHLTDGTRVEAAGVLGEVTASLPPHRFQPCHRFYCVNLDQVRAIHYGSVDLLGGERVPVGRRYQKDFERAFLYATRRAK